MTIEHCPECLTASVQNNKDAICQQPLAPGGRDGARSELFIMIEMIEPGVAGINHEEIFSSTGRIFN